MEARGEKQVPGNPLNITHGHARQMRQQPIRLGDTTDGDRLLPHPEHVVHRVFQSHQQLPRVVVFGAPQFRAADGPVTNSRELLDDRLDGRSHLARIAASIDDKRPCVIEPFDLRADFINQASFFSHFAKEPRGHVGPEEDVEQLQREPVRMRAGHRVGPGAEVHLLGLFFPHAQLRPTARTRGSHERTHRRPWHRPEGRADLVLNASRIERASARHEQIARMIHPSPIANHILPRDAPDGLLRPGEDGAERVIRPEQLTQQVMDILARRVFIHPDFFKNDLSLFIHVLTAQGRKSDHLRQRLDGSPTKSMRDFRHIAGEFFSGESIQRAPDTFDRLLELLTGPPPRAFKHQMLEKMGNPGVSRRFIPAPCPSPHAYCD